jgi:SulP family sulfate permease
MDGPEVNQPGLGRLRQVVAQFVNRRLPSRGTFRQDAVSGLTVTVSVVPDGLANGLLAGVNPIYGLYANMIGPIVGGVLTCSRMMVINSTSAAALVAGQALLPLSSEDRPSALFVMVIAAGVLGVALGVLGLGRLTRFVSFSVMTGFIAGIAVVLILGQLPTITGVDAEGESRIAQTLHVLSHIGQLHLPSASVAGLAFVLGYGLARSPLSTVAGLVAIAAPTALVVFAGLEGVATVGDIGEISGGLPSPFFPSASDVTFATMTGALSVAIIVLVQGAGVSQSVPNVDGSRSDPSRDFVAQGAANIASGLFRGLPVGGSLGGTALNVVSGGRGRWAGILSGVWMAVIVLGIPGIVTRVVMPALGALLIVAAISSVNPSEIASVWRAGWPSRLAAMTTFVSTLVLPIQVAVGFGVVLSALLYVTESSTDVSVVELVEHRGGRIEEKPRPKRLSSDTVTVLDVYGHLFFAGARTLEQLLPSVPADIEHPVVILRLRGRTSLGATLVEVISGYADRLRAVEGRLYVAGVGEDVLRHLTQTGTFKQTAEVRAYPATPFVLEATRQAKSDAEAWLVTVHEEGSAGPSSDPSA